MFPTRLQKTRPFLINASGFTLGQLLASLTIISTVALFVAAVYTVVAPIKTRSESFYCTVNIKQISLALLQYSQDYDEKFPPCAQQTTEHKYLSGWAVAHDKQGKDLTTDSAGADWSPKNPSPNGLLYPYSETTSDFRCFSVPDTSGPVSYMYNDLAAGVAQKDFAAPDKTVLVCDGEDFAGNVGHAYEPDNLAGAPQFSRDGAVVFGATLQTAPLRHNGGANYGFVDGHVKWSKPGSIYFPFRLNDNRSHIDKHNGEALGPDPTKLAPLGYIGTFHVK